MPPKKVLTISSASPRSKPVEKRDSRPVSNIKKKQPSPRRNPTPRRNKGKKGRRGKKDHPEVPPYDAEKD